MNTAQTLTTLGALMFLSVTVLNLYRFIGDSDNSLAQDQFRLEALSLINTYIDQTSTLYFDESLTDPTQDNDLGGFTASNSFGFDNNDNGAIDDFDDYHNSALIDTGQSGTAYQVFFEVEYVDLQGSQIVTSSPSTYHKRMSIFVTDNYSTPVIYKYVNDQKVKDTLSVSFVKSYWFYN